jgi:hypothetical protein
MDLGTEQLPVFLPRSSRFVVGLDLGQSTDPTAIAVLEKKIGVLDFRNAYDRHCNIAGPPQKPDERIEVRHLERLPLGLTYPTIVSRVGELLGRVPLCGGDNQKPAELVIDETGVGRPVGDIFVESGLKPIRVSITAGSEITPQGGNRWHVAKSILISNLDALLNTGELKFAAALTEADAMKEELKDFRRKLSETGKATYAARVGRHDDLVLSVAIAAWWLCRPPPAYAQFTTYGLAGPGESTQNSYGGGN